MHQGDIESLAVRLTAFTALLEQHSVQALEQSATAAQGERFLENCCFETEMESPEGPGLALRVLPPRCEGD